MQSYFYIERSITTTISGTAPKYVSAFSQSTTAVNNFITSSSNGDLTWDNSNWRLNVNKSGYYLFSFVANYAVNTAGAGTKNIDGYINLYVNSNVSQSKPFNTVESTAGTDSDYVHFIEYIQSGNNVSIALDTGSIPDAPTNTEQNTWGLLVYPGTSLAVMSLENAFGYQQITSAPATGTFFATGTEVDFYSQSLATSFKSNLWSFNTGSLTSSITQPHLVIMDHMIGISGAGLQLASPYNFSVIGTNLTTKLYKNESLAASYAGTAFQSSEIGTSQDSEPDIVRGFFLDNTTTGDAFRTGINPTVGPALQIYGSSSFSAIQIPSYTKAYSLRVITASSFQTRTGTWQDSPFSSSLYSGGTADLTQSAGSTIITYNTASGDFTINEAGTYYVIYHSTFARTSSVKSPKDSQGIISFQPWLQYSRSVGGVGAFNSGSVSGVGSNSRKTTGGGSVGIDATTNRFQTINQGIITFAVGDKLTPLLSSSFGGTAGTSSFIAYPGTSLTVIQLGALTIAPTITITSPTTASTYSTTASTITLTGSTTNTPTAIAWNNYTNATTGTGSYDSTTFTISSISLISGSNSIGITGSNGAGSGSDSIVVSYNPIPSLSITSPTSNTTYSTTSSTIVLTGSQSYASSVSWNNYANSTSDGGTVGASTFTLTSITLASGSNFIAVTGTNANGSSYDTITVSYTPLPQISITSPTTASVYTSSVGTITLTGSQSYGTSFTWNNYTNATTGTGSYDSSTFTMSSITLITGANSIAVTGSNSVGIGTDTITVSYEYVDFTCSSSAAGLPPVIDKDFTINLYSNNNTQITKLKASTNAPCPQLPFSFSTPGPLSLRGRQSAPIITSGDKKN